MVRTALPGVPVMHGRIPEAAAPYLSRVREVLSGSNGAWPALADVADLMVRLFTEGALAWRQA